MKTLALTGGIASGKSTAARLFAALGARVLSADEDARAVLEEIGTRAAVFAAFPFSRRPDGSVDRQALAIRVFGDSDARAQLEAIMHPRIRARMRGALERARPESSGLLVYEVPLLFEAGLEGWFDAVAAVLATPEAQAARLQERERNAGRPALSDAAVASRLAMQLSPEEKARRATYVIPTAVPIEDTAATVSAIWDRLVGGETPSR